MGQQTSRSTSQQPINHCYPSHYNSSQEWPRWASGLTQGLPQEGDRGLFRGEFILVQAQPALRQAVETHPRCMQLYTRQYSHPCRASTALSENSIQTGRNGPCLRLNRDTQSHVFSHILNTRLGHIPEEDDEDKQENTTRCNNESRTENKYNKESDKRISPRNSNVSSCEDDKRESDDEAFNYFANNLIKPVFVTSHRYGSFQTMTSRYSCMKQREDVRAIKSLPRQKNINNGPTKIENKCSNSHFLDLADYGIYKNIHFPMCSTLSRNENIYDIADVPRKKRPSSPVKDYSSSESGISDSDDLAAAFSPSKKILYSRRRRKPNQMISKCRRNSSSADSAFKDVDNLSSNSSEKNDCEIKAKSKISLNRESTTTVEEKKYQKLKEKGRRNKYQCKTDEFKKMSVSNNQESDHDSKQSSEDDDDFTSSLSGQLNTTFHGNEKSFLLNDMDSEFKIKSEKMLYDFTTDKTGCLVDSEIDKTKSNIQNSKHLSDISISKIHNTKSENYETISTNEQRNNSYLPLNISQTSFGNCNPYETFLLKPKSTSLPASPEIRHEAETKRKGSAQPGFLTVTKCSSGNPSEKDTNKQSSKTRIQELQDILMRKSLPLSSPQAILSSQSSSPSLERSSDFKSENATQDVCEIRCKSPKILRCDHSSDETNSLFEQRLNLSNMKISDDINNSPTNRHKSDYHDLKNTSGEIKDEVKVKTQSLLKEKSSSCDEWTNENCDKSSTFSPTPPPAPPLPDCFKVSRTSS